MSVRFVIGRAGAGKTRHCLSAIREALVQSPLDGPALLLIVPEQAALQMERALIADPRLGPPTGPPCWVSAGWRSACSKTPLPAAPGRSACSGDP